MIKSVFSIILLLGVVCPVSASDSKEGPERTSSQLQDATVNERISFVLVKVEQTDGGDEGGAEYRVIKLLRNQASFLQLKIAPNVSNEGRLRCLEQAVGKGYKIVATKCCDTLVTSCDEMISMLKHPYITPQLWVESVHTEHSVDEDA